MKKWIIIIIGGCALAASAAIATLSVSLKSKAEMCAELKQRTKEQSRVIDSLLNKRDKFIDIQMHVTDKSKFAVYGKYNKGTIYVPSERTYELKIDSTSISMK